MNDSDSSTQDDKNQYSYEEETRHTYRRMIAVMFVGEDNPMLPENPKYWDIVFDYFTAE